MALRQHAVALGIGFVAPCDREAGAGLFFGLKPAVLGVVLTIVFTLAEDALNQN